MKQSIVCYMGGTCGDLITAIVDPGSAGFGSNGNVILSDERSRLKKPHEFASDSDKDAYLESVFTKYVSIPSHDIEYHIRRQHRFIGISVTTLPCALWAANRFKKLHRPSVWAEMTAFCGADDVTGYAQAMLDYSKMLVTHTSDVLLLEDILNGKAIDKLTAIIGELKNSTAATDFYNRWISKQSL